MAGSAPILTTLPHASALTEDQGIEQFGSRRRAIERDDEGAPTRSPPPGLTATNDDAPCAGGPAKPPIPEVRQRIDVDHLSRPRSIPSRNWMTGQVRAPRRSTPCRSTVNVQYVQA